MTTAWIAELDRLVDGVHHDPHAILGPHVGPEGVTIRVLRPLAESVTVVSSVARTALAHEHRGVFSATLPATEVPDYRLEVIYSGPGPVVVDDPYRFLPTLGELDLHLFVEGRHETLWTVLGAHVRRYESASGEIAGVSFAVWAPNARGVRLLCDTNHWDGTAFPLRSLGASGVWEIFVPGLDVGERYKFSLNGPDGQWRTKADPMARATQSPPETASVVTTSGGYVWADADWLQSRSEHNVHNGPMSIYEVHLGSWRPGLSYRQLADELTGYVVDCGFTHVELLPVMEHPYGPSWGYQVTSYYAPSARLGVPDDLRYLIDRLHQAGVGVILDWVPAHFPKDDWALARFDGTHLYEHADPQRGEQLDWGTYIFDFGRPEVRNFLVANATYWLEEFHADGLRVDAVASMLYLDYSREPGEWTPNIRGGQENLEAVEFIKEMNATAYRRSPGVVTIAEESTAWPGVTQPTDTGGLGFGGLGFGLKWNMGWMHDTLGYVGRDPIHRQFHHGDMTFSLMYAWSEQYCLPLSHDEVVHGKGALLAKMPGDHWQQLATLRAYFAFMWAHPGKQLIFMGAEIGQYAEWSEPYSLDWWQLDNADHRGLHRCVRDLNNTYTSNAPMWQRDNDSSGFEWIDANDSPGNIFSWLRWDDARNAVAVIVNFSPTPHDEYRVGLPHAGEWTEILNTDAEIYSGSGVGNFGTVVADDSPWQDQPASATIRVPPLGALWLRAPTR